MKIRPSLADDEARQRGETSPEVQYAKRGYQWPHKMDWCPQKKKKQKTKTKKNKKQKRKKEKDGNVNSFEEFNAGMQKFISEDVIAS